MQSSTTVGPRTFRFRTDREPDSPRGERRWMARYSCAGGWAPFDIAIDFDRRVLAISRTSDIPYGGLLCDLVETMSGVETSSVPLVRKPATVLRFPCDIIGVGMTRHADTGGGVPADNGRAGYFRDDPPGGWLVMRAMVPESGGSFLIAINDKQGSGEIVSYDTQEVYAVIDALTDLFADT